MIEAKYQFRFEAMTLWRDGNQAVVSIKLNDRWIRVLSIDCRGNFHEELTADELRDLSADTSARKTRNFQKLPTGLLHRLAPAWKESAE